MKNNSTLRYLSQVTGKKKLLVAALLLVQVLLGVSGVGYALLLREAIDAAVAKVRSDFGLYIGFFVALVLAQMLLRVALRFLDEYCRSGVENCFKERLFDRLLRGSYSRVTMTHSGEWLNRLTSDTSVIADGVTSIIPGATGMAVKLVAALVAMIVLEPKFAYLLVPGGVLLFVLTYSFRKVLKRLHKNMQEADGKVRVFLQEHLGSLMVVKTFAAEEETSRQAGEHMTEHRRVRMRRNHFSNVCNFGFGAVMHGAYVAGIIYCGYGILAGTVTYGTMTAIMQLVTQVQAPMANITMYLPKYYAMIASAERLMEAEGFEGQEEPLSAQQANALYAEELRDICFEDVSFAYPKEGAVDVTPEEMVLKDFNLRLTKGEFVALTGSSGCGKSTFLKLLLCLYEPTMGRRHMTVCKGGTECNGIAENAGDLDVSNGEKISLTSEHRRLFAYVPQGNHLMSGTVRQVIAFGQPEAGRDEERLRRALKIACADFVWELKNGVDTVLGERGAGISEGQMQRLAVARAIFSESPVLILDEATSALDEATEEQLLKNLRALTDKTVLIVTHRPAALAVCDREVRL